MTVVVDASVALKWVLPEDGADAAEALLAAPIHAPDILLAECGNVLWTASVRRRVTAARSREALEFIASVPMTMHPCVPLVIPALDLALELNHPAYDCLYVVLARRLNLPLVTADKVLVRAAGLVKDLDVTIVPLAGSS